MRRKRPAWRHMKTGVFIVSVNARLQEKWRCCEWRNSKLREKEEWDLDEPAAQDWSALSAEATPSEVPAKQIYFTPV